MVGLRLKQTDEPLGEPEEEEMNLFPGVPQKPSHPDKLDEGGSYSPVEDPHLSVGARKVMAFFEELDAEGGLPLAKNSQQSTGSQQVVTFREKVDEEGDGPTGIISAKTFAATCRIKRSSGRRDPAGQKNFRVNGSSVTAPSRMCGTPHCSLQAPVRLRHKQHKHSKYVKGSGRKH